MLQSPTPFCFVSEIKSKGRFFETRICRCWNSLNSHAFGPLDTDQYARHIPVGRVCAERTSRAPLTETELGNMYAGSFVFNPGPCAYGGESAKDLKFAICIIPSTFYCAWYIGSFHSPPADGGYESYCRLLHHTSATPHRITACPSYHNITPFPLTVTCDTCFVSRANISYYDRVTRVASSRSWPACSTCWCNYRMPTLSPSSHPISLETPVASDLQTLAY